MFIDGCFWHACPERAPLRKNTGYWGPKLTGNVERDRRYDKAQRPQDGLVVRAWKHEDAEATADRVEAALAARRSTA